jgi:hypothetical protein
MYILSIVSEFESRRDDNSFVLKDNKNDDTSFSKQQSRVTIRPKKQTSLDLEE